MVIIHYYTLLGLRYTNRLNKILRFITFTIKRNTKFSNYLDTLLRSN